MPPSSLIFVVILAVWAAYLIQHWVRRRDHIATARSVDRFSEAMRVLERRQRGPRIDLSTPAPRSYAVSPARPAHPDVVVKRARPAPGRGPGEAPTASGSSSYSSPSSPTRAVTAPLSGARGRGTTLVLASVAMVLGTALGVLEVWPLWTVAAGVGVFVLTLAVVRTSVRRSTVALPSSVRRPQPPRGTSGPDDTTPAGRPRPRTRPTRSLVTATGGAAAALAAKDSAAAQPVGPQAPVASATVRRRAARTTVFDVDALDVEVREPGHRAESSAARVNQAAAVRGSWQPTPVPPPTYTLKAKAGPPHTGSSAVPTTRPEGSQELPFDGYALAFDEESEELPAVHSLG